RCEVRGGWRARRSTRCGSWSERSRSTSTSARWTTSRAAPFARQAAHSSASTCVGSRRRRSVAPTGSRCRSIPIPRRSRAAGPGARSSTMARRRKVVIVGGGIAGLTAAYELTRTPESRAQWEVEVFEMGHRFGGRLASHHRPEAWGRNEEHGLHVWFGFYDNTFRLAEQVWNAWDRPADCPWSSVWEALRPIYFSDHAFDEG